MQTHGGLEVMTGAGSAGRSHALRAYALAATAAGSVAATIGVDVATFRTPRVVAAVVGALALAAAATAIATLPLALVARRPLRRLRGAPAPARLSNLLDEALIAGGADATDHVAVAVADPALNVGAFPLDNGGIAVVATTAALEQFTRDELGAQVFAQAAIASSRWSRLAARSLFATRVLPVAGLLALPAVLTPLGHHIVPTMTAAAAVAMWVIFDGGLRVARCRALCNDAVARTTARLPDALASSLDILASGTATRLRIGWSAFADPFLAVTTAADAVTSVDGRVVSTTATEARALLEHRAAAQLAPAGNDGGFDDLRARERALAPTAQTQASTSARWLPDPWQPTSDIWRRWDGRFHAETRPVASLGATLDGVLGALAGTVRPGVAAWHPDPFRRETPILRWWDGHHWTGWCSPPDAEPGSSPPDD